MKTPLLALAILSLAAVAPASADWPHPRGPAMDGRTLAPGTFEGDVIALDVAWRVPLGSAYSGIAIADGRAVTMFARDGADWIGAFDAATGKEAWRQRLGDLSQGHDGSDDGPLSSPVIGGGRVYAIAPAGRLVALRLADGAVVWEKDLERDLGGKKPDFGFTTTPALAGNVFVVQAGGSEQRSIVGLDSADGRTLWSHGDSKVDYQSPAVMTLAGKRQIVAVTKGSLTGLLPETGAVLWTHALAEEDRVGSANPTFIGEDRFLVNIAGKMTAFSVSETAGTLAVRELYRSETLGGNSYAPPVIHDGHAYGFRGQILGCMDLATGAQVWRSRPPGGDGLILVDGHLVIFAGKGSVVVARATPRDYEEVARLQVFEGSGLTWPSFDGGRIYVRNLSEMAAVSVAHAAASTAGAEKVTASHEFGRWLLRAEQAEARQPLVDALFEHHAKMPIVEGEYVHFVVRANAQDLGIQGSMNDTETPEPMQRLAGTDLFYRSYRLPPGARWEYHYQVDFDAWITDPRNPRTVPELEGEGQMSELVAEGYAGADYLGEPQGPRGRLDEFTLPSKILGYDKKIQVWLPSGYDAGDRSYPLLIVNDGPAWVERGRMAVALDNLVGKSVAPVVVAFVDTHAQWWLEAGGSRAADYVRMQVEELLPALGARYRLADGAGSRGVLGHRFHGVTSAYAALRHPDVFGKVAIQSVYLGLGLEGELAALIRSGAGSKSRIYFDWNRFDERNVDREWDFAADSRTLAGLLRAGGYAFEGGEVLDSWGWGGWRSRTGRMLTALFPL